jgi:hypothetical protein
MMCLQVSGVPSVLAYLLFLRICICCFFVSATSASLLLLRHCCCRIYVVAATPTVTSVPAVVGDLLSLSETFLTFLLSLQLLAYPLLLSSLLFLAFLLFLTILLLRSPLLLLVFLLLLSVASSCII